MATYSIAGLYREEVLAPPLGVLRTGVPAFLAQGPGSVPAIQAITAWSQFVALHDPRNSPYLSAAVRGFFHNGGELCYLVWQPAGLRPDLALAESLDELEHYSAVDLVCMPEVMQTPDHALVLQQQLVAWCDRSHERFAILDPFPDAPLDAIVGQWQQLQGMNAALYYPWLKVSALAGAGEIAVPPCGHLAGCYSRTDRERGVFHAPANSRLEGIHDLVHELTNSEQAALNPVGVVNCIRAFPGRGIRAWGARTINGQPDWRYINVRRLFLTCHRWLNLSMASVAYEPNDRMLWARIRRTLTAYMESLYMRGALAGATPAEAYYVRCDASTTPPALRDDGQVVAEIGMAPAVPSEFLVIRIVYGAGEAVAYDDALAPDDAVAHDDDASVSSEVAPPADSTSSEKEN